MRNPRSLRRCVSLIALALMLTGCIAAPYDSCFGEGAEPGWRAIEAPSERDSLLDLRPLGNDAVTARKYLDLQATGELDAWFRHGDGRLMACAHAPGKQVCHGSSGRTVEFHRNGDTWVARNPQQIECAVVTS